MNLALNGMRDDQLLTLIQLTDHVLMKTRETLRDHPDAFRGLSELADTGDVIAAVCRFIDADDKTAALVLQSALAALSAMNHSVELNRELRRRAAQN